jgi:hypothetical protein
MSNFKSYSDSSGTSKASMRGAFIPNQDKYTKGTKVSIKETLETLFRNAAFYDNFNQTVRSHIINQLEEVLTSKYKTYENLPTAYHDIVIIDSYFERYNRAIVITIHIKGGAFVNMTSKNGYYELYRRVRNQRSENIIVVSASPDINTTEAEKVLSTIKTRFFEEGKAKNKNRYLVPADLEFYKGFLTDKRFF